MKKTVVSVLLAVLLAAVFLPGACAEGKMELSPMLTGDPFPVYYQAFLSEPPAYPKAEKTGDGCLITGLRAWGAAPEGLTAWTMDATSQSWNTEWVQDPSVSFEDAVLATVITDLPDLAGVSLRIPAEGAEYDGIEIVYAPEPDPYGSFPDGIMELNLIKGPYKVSFTPNGMVTYSLDGTLSETGTGFTVSYRKTGELEGVNWSADGYRYIIWRMEDGADGVPVYAASEYSFNDNDWQGLRPADPEKMPFALASETPVTVIPEPEYEAEENPEEEPAEKREDDPAALAALPQERSVPRSWPMPEGIGPEELPNHIFEREVDGQIWKTLNWRAKDWTITATYAEGSLLYYTAVFERADMTYGWQVDCDGDAPRYAAVWRFGADGEEGYRLDPEKDQWYDESDGTPCDPPDFLEICPLMPLV